MPEDFSTGIEDLLLDDTQPVAAPATESAVSIEPVTPAPAAPAAPVTPAATTPAETPTTPETTPTSDTVDWDTLLDGELPAGTPAVAMPSLLGEVAQTMGLDWVPESPAELAQSIQEHIAEQIRVGVEARSTDAVRDANSMLRLDDYELVRTTMHMQRDALQRQNPGALVDDDDDIERKLTAWEEKDQIIARAKAIRSSIEADRDLKVQQTEQEAIAADRQQKAAAREAAKANEAARQRVIAVGTTTKDLSGNPYGQKTIEAMASYLTSDDYFDDFYKNPTPAIRAMQPGAEKENAIYQYHFLRALAQHPRTAKAFAEQQSKYPTAHLDTPLARQLLTGGAPVATASSVPAGISTGVGIDDIAEFTG